MSNFPLKTDMGVTKRNEVRSLMFGGADADGREARAALS